MAAAKLEPALLASIARRLAAARGWKSASLIFEALGVPSRLPQDAGTLAAQRQDMLRLWESTEQLAAARITLEPLGLWPLPAGAASPADGGAAWSSRCQSALDLLTAQQAYFGAVRLAAVTFPIAGKLPAAALSRLEKEGLNVETLVGTSEFRLPVAVVSGTDQDSYALAILCEEGEKETDVYED